MTEDLEASVTIAPAPSVASTSAQDHPAEENDLGQLLTDRLAQMSRRMSNALNTTASLDA